MDSVLDSHPYVKEYCLVIGFFIILTAVLTYPLIFHISDTIGGGDEAFTCWSLAWTTHSLIENPLNLFHANIFYPENEYSFALSEHLIGWAPFSIPLYLVTHDPVITHNLLKLFTFVLCGFGAYLLSYRYTHNRYAALVAGICFAFFSYRLNIQLHLLAMEWIPFLLLYLDKYLHSLKLRDLGGFVFFFLLSMLSGWYVGIFTGIIVGVYGVLYLIFDSDLRTRFFTRNTITWLLISLIVIILVLLPVAIPYFHASNLYNAERGLEDPVKSAYSLDIIPIITLLGPYSVLLALIGLIFPLSGYGSTISLLSGIKKQKIPLIFGSLIFISYLLMIGPILKIGGVETGGLGPYYYLYKLFPFIAIVRDLSRFSFIMSFAVSILAGFGVASILEKVHKKNLKLLLSLVLVTLMIISSWHGPVSLPQSLATGKNIPEEYTWLANQSGDPVIIELPTRWVEDNSEYTYYSVYHWKRMVNGYSGRDVETASKIMRDTGQYFPSNTSISLLQNLGISYVIIHTDRMAKMYNISQSDSQNFETAYITDISSKVSSNFSSVVKPVTSFGSTYIYEILQQPQLNPDSPVIIYQNGWFGADISSPFYLKDKGKIKILAKEEGDYLLQFVVQPFYGDKSLSIVVNNENLGSNVLKDGGFSNGDVLIHLHKGFNELQFVSSGCTKVCDVPEMNTIYDRCISFAFMNLTVS